MNWISGVWRIGMATVICLAMAATAQAQTEEYASVAGYLGMRDTSYADVHPGTLLVLGNVPVEIVLTLNNRTADDLSLGADESTFGPAFKMTLSRQDDDRSVVVDDVLMRPAGGQPDPGAVLARGKYLTARLQITRRNGEPLAPGLYILEYGIDVDALPARARGLPNILRRTLRFEVRNPGSLPEVIDEHLQSAHAAAVDGRRGDEQRFLKLALQLNPNSVPALLDLSNGLYRGGDCTNALPLLKRSVSVIRSRSDTLLRRPADEGILPVIEQQIRRCSGR